MLLHNFSNKDQLFFLLAQGATVLTPNNRLNESIIQQYFTHCNIQTVDKPKCMPYRAALIKAYEQLNFIHANGSYPILLNDTQCQYLWRKIIKSEPSITYSEGLLQSVITAWEDCQQWQINPENPKFLYTQQTHQFQQWWLEFEKQLKQQHLITEHQLIPHLLNAQYPLFSDPIIWVCFDDFTPLQLHLQEQLINQGITQYRYDLKEKSSKIEMLEAQDDKEEYQQLMLWLHLKIQEGHHRIGVVVPNLEKESNLLQRMLAHHFDSTFFNISLGQPLSDFPLVAHALCWLNLDDFTLTQHQASLLLQSPYLGYSKEEFIERTEYLQESDLLEKQLILLKNFIEELHFYTPKLSKLLSRLISYPPMATPQEWASLFQDRLKMLGFPGDYGLNSENYQCLNRFITLFDELRQLAVFNSYLTKTEALETLYHLAQYTIFQAQKNNAPIQISGLLEASGCEFDSLWVMGLTDQCLPQKVHLSAFVPSYLQRELRMPHSLPERELQFARQILQRLQRSADSVVFSFAQLQGDNPNLPCSLITKFPHFNLLPVPHSIYKPQYVTVEEQFSLPVSPEERITGGTAILANQAKCPFKAFAEHRLRVKAPLQTTDGLNHKERGKIIHKVMELLWQALETQEKLQLLAPQILDEYIDKAIHTALSHLNQSTNFLSAPVQEVESTRLKRLIHIYLEWEKQRAPFTIAALEHSYSISLAGLEIHVRIDRLDQVADKKWVIDYKSTLPTSKPWHEERPKEPQLLLYALLDDQINTVLLMQLKSGKICCAGLSEEKQTIHGITSLKKDETWAECRKTWQKQLTHLAMEFQQGYCPPQPAHPSICQQCDFQNLCRIQDNE
ncbi:PD-(D/E)XK nuclease family protein [Legionella sainthelensi]|uniref:Endonuclease n=1 Tax=Legionella sainthelensi TaxID=28087 RepID=A0A2H5FQ68_9GAMM|nr:PD-(D/E)XK nuclease family protein [Legionella sainthelensi]AUH73714.1 PD-(D/E)XK nuclease family protein [Legionella sainthelensi]